MNPMQSALGGSHLPPGGAPIAPPIAPLLPLGCLPGLALLPPRGAPIAPAFRSPLGLGEPLVGHSLTASRQHDRGLTGW